MNKMLFILGIVLAFPLFGTEGVFVLCFESKNITEREAALCTNFLVGELAGYYDILKIEGKKRLKENIWEDGELGIRELEGMPEVPYIVTGWLERDPDKFSIKVAVFSAKNGEIAFSRGRSCKSWNEVITFIKDFVRAFVDYLETNIPTRHLNQEARAIWTVGEALFTLSYYGWAIPYVLGIEDGKVILATEMTLPLAVLIGGLNATKTSSVTNSQAINSLGGAGLGIADGIFLNNIFDVRDEQTKFVFPVSLSLLENFGGFVLPDRLKMTEGETEFSILCAAEGYFYGYGFGELFDVDSDRTRGLLYLGTRIPSQLIGYRIAKAREYTSGDAGIILTAGLLGAGTTCNLLFQFDAKEGKPYIGGAMLGNIAGAIIMDRIKGERHFSGGNGMLAYAGAYLGALFGGGLNILFETSDQKISSATVNLSSILGFALTYNLMK